MKSITRTLIGSKLQTALMLGLTHTYDQHTTLNELFEIQSGVLPPTTTNPKMGYLAVGDGGHYMATGSDGVAYPADHQHRASDQACFNHLPWILRPVDHDLTKEERDKYALRREELHGEDRYFAYYLKRVDLTGANIELLHTVVVDGNESTVPYNYTSANLNPTPPTLSNTGAVATSGDYLTSRALLDLNMSDSDVAEFVNVAKVLYGNPKRAIISELAICSGVDKQVTGAAATGANIQVKEAIGVQVCAHLTACYTVGYSNAGFDFQLDYGATEPMLASDYSDTTVTV